MSLREYLDFFHSAVGRIDQSILQVKEYIDAKYKIEKISCAYQYQNGIK